MGKKVVLKASAGTGKTYRLSLEYIASLMQGINFKDILVMTFTKKATSEIKERILKFLKEICESKDKKEEIEKNLKNIYGENFTLEVPKVKRIYKNIVENKDSLKIFTIDSFTNMIFKKAIAPYLKIYSYEIIDEEENKKILIKTFEKLFESKEDFSIFKSFLEDNSEKNMDIYVELIKNIINQRWKMILIGGGLKEREHLEHKLVKPILDKMEEILEEVANIKGKAFTDLIKTSYQGYFSSDNKDEYIKENYKIFLKDKFWDGRNGKVKSTKGDIDSQIEDLTYLYGEFRENLGKEMYNNLVIPYEKKLLRVVEKVYSIYDEIKFREKRFTHTDISNYTFKFLEDRELGFVDENGLTEEFFEIIDGRVVSVFIDEFQDTSILQWRILKNILDKCENIICVGDEKQSIYGWRGGEKKLFENLAQIIDGEEEELGICFRSKKNIVEYTNEVFTDIAKESMELYPYGQDWKFNEVEYLENEKSEQGLVKLLTGQEEREAIDVMIDEIESSFSDNYGGIGILARTKKTLERIAFSLKEREIPYVLESDVSIVECSGIEGVYALIVWLVKKDFLSLLDFLRSKLVNISAPTLKTILERKKEVENYLYGDGNLEIEEEIFSTLKEIYKNYCYYSGETEFLTYDMLVKIGIGNRFQSTEDTLNIFGIYKLLKEYKYFNDFIIEYEENSKKDKFKKISTVNNNAIPLMTIHKSKGLEFDTLFYFIPTKGRNSGDRGMEFYFEMDKGYSNVNSYLLTDNKFNNILENISEIKYLEEKNIKREHEEINNLYVALTRPKNNIFVVVESVEEIEKSSFSTLLKNRDRGEILLDKVSLLEERKSIECDITLSNPMVINKSDRLENQKEGINKIYSHTLQIEGKRVRGLIVHFFLENILHWDSEEVELSKKLTYAKYTSVIGEKEMNRLLSNENIEYIFNQCRSIFDTSWDYVYREYPIYFKVKGESKNYRIDRLMIKLPKEDEKGIVYIADYKTGKHSEEQLENYKLAIIEKIKRSGMEIEKFNILTEYIELDM